MFEYYYAFKLFKKNWKKIFFFTYPNVEKLKRWLDLIRSVTNRRLFWNNNKHERVFDEKVDIEFELRRFSDSSFVWKILLVPEMWQNILTNQCEVGLETLKPQWKHLRGRKNFCFPVKFLFLYNLDPSKSPFWTESSFIFLEAPKATKSN